MASLDATIEALYARGQFGIRPGLGNIRKLLAELGDPQDAIPMIVHVAGTNGKGSVCAMLDAILGKHGLSCGRYTSPHVQRLHERFSVNGHEPDDMELMKMISAVESAADRADIQATFFECTTAMALKWFSDRAVSCAIIETGMGGRLDATNVVEPTLSVITSIGFDHTEYLGHSLPDIAAEKGGIIKKGVPVLLGNLEPSVATCITDIAETRQSTVIKVSERISVRRVSEDMSSQKLHMESDSQSYGTIQFPIPGNAAMQNAALALAAAEILADGTRSVLNVEKVRAALSGLQWRARMQMLSASPFILLDAAHNSAGVQELTATLERNDQPPAIFVFGMCEDKDVEKVVHTLAPHAFMVVCVPIENKRGISPDKLTKIFEGQAVTKSADSVVAGLALALEVAQKEQRPICITGSVYLAGEVLDLWPEFQESHGLS